MMSSNSSIAERFLAQRGMRCSGGSAMQLLSPYFLMDVAYGIYCRELRDAGLRGECKMWLRRWGEAYCKFNREVFRGMDSDDIDVLCDMMDECGTYLGNYIEICRLDIMELMYEYPESSRGVLCNVMLCRLISYLSGVLWEGLYRDKWGRGTRNMLLDGMVRYMERTAYCYDRGLGIVNSIDVAKCEKLKVDCNVLTRKLVSWVGGIKEECV